MRQSAGEKRRSQRVNLLSSGWLHHNDSKYNCRINNISRNGVLLVVKNTSNSSFQAGDKCYLMLHQTDNLPEYKRVNAQIIRFESDIVAVEFTEPKNESHDFVDNIVQKELHFISGVQDLISLGREVAKQQDVNLTVLCFDNGQLNPDREMHTLRLASGGHTINVHLHREEIEAFHIQKNSERTKSKIRHAIERLNVA